MITSMWDRTRVAQNPGNFGRKFWQKWSAQPTHTPTSHGDTANFYVTSSAPAPPGSSSALKLRLGLREQLQLLALVGGCTCMFMCSPCMKPRRRGWEIFTPYKYVCRMHACGETGRKHARRTHGDTRESTATILWPASSAATESAVVCTLQGCLLT